MEKPASTRQLKVAREIQKELAEIIRAKGMAAFDGALVTVSEVRVSPDLSVAKVFVSIFPSDKQGEVMHILELLAVKTSILPSKGEARKMVQGNGIAINKDKVTDIGADVTEADIVNGHYILAQKGKKNYFIIHVK